ncbi:MAG: ribonuclease III [Candidatus Pacebacteria bacterium]|nr:ribonuclease III [Candidatus Paceibacterota bacterium]
MKEFNLFEDKVGVTFKDKDLLQLAFTHRSFVNENRQFNAHNERLEFLGDAVLELVVTEYLFEQFPDKAEGELTAVRAALVNTQSISKAAKELDMNDYLLLSKGEEKDTGRARQYILANTFEAFIGALHLDQGYAAAQKFIANALFSKVQAIVDDKLWQDAKSKLQEEAQEHMSITPNYQIISEGGPDHNKVFTIAVMFDGVEIAQGIGNSKQDAEQVAAQNAIEVNGW